ncbi:hypothetical protein B6D52_01450 [Candidatus Parcubacteria bacterium 4484_255]|nr:MAG: hypothetical protein B6D52_01450 [Candidatus Parcubacteria bacterium 4484_255]
MINKEKIFLLLLCLFFLFADFCFVGAVSFIPQVGIPGSDFKTGQPVGVSGSSFIDYLSAIYKWSVGAIAIMAIIMIMVAGFQWITAAGNATVIGQAKSRINSSMVGLLLAIGAYSILNFINPSLVHLRALRLGKVEYVDLGVSEPFCKSGRQAYKWNSYYCFDMGRDELIEQYAPIMDFGLPPEAAERVVLIVFSLGVDTKHKKECNVKKNFELSKNKKGSFGEHIDYHRIIACDGRSDEIGSDDPDPEDDFQEYTKSATCIMLVEDFSSDNYLKGFNVYAANGTPGSGSAVIYDIKLYTDLPCTSEDGTGGSGGSS